MREAHSLLAVMRNPQQLKDLVQTAMDAILVRHDRAGVRRYFHPDFVQHNPWAEDGSAQVKAMCDFSFSVKMTRWAVQGDIVAYHGYYTAPNPLGEHPLLFADMWRVQGDQIVEHWDALQPRPQDVLNSVLEGPGDGFALVNPARVAANAASARRLVELGINRGDETVMSELLASNFTLHRQDTLPGPSRAGFVGWVKEG